jgi:hypothetical protein
MSTRSAVVKRHYVQGCYGCGSSRYLVVATGMLWVYLFWNNYSLHPWCLADGSARGPDGGAHGPRPGTGSGTGQGTISDFGAFIGTSSCTTEFGAKGLG